MTEKTGCILKWTVNPCEQDSTDDAACQMSPPIIGGNMKWIIKLETLRNLDDDICQLQLGITSPDINEPLQISASFVSCTNKFGAAHIALTDITTVKSNEFTLFSPIDLSLKCFNYEAIEITLDFAFNKVGIVDVQDEINNFSPCSWFSANSKTPSPVGICESPIEFSEEPNDQLPRPIAVPFPLQNVLPSPLPPQKRVYMCYNGTVPIDVTLTCQDRYYLCHKSVLASKSTLFAKLFSSTSSDAFNHIIPLDSIDYIALYDIIHYIYTGTAPELAKKACYLLGPAAIFQLNELKMVCETFACEQINIDNAAELLMLSYSSETDRLKQIALEFVVQHMDDMLQMDYFVRAMQNNGLVCFDVMKKALKK